MAWVIGIFCGLLALALLFRYPVQVIILVVIVVGGGWLWIDSTTKANQRRYQQARSLVTPAQVELADLRLGNSYGSSWTLTGNATNKSSHTITSLEIQATIQNCPAGKPCVTIGQTSVYNSVNIPPGQMRALSGYASFPNLPPLDGWTWHYSIGTIAAVN